MRPLWATVRELLVLGWRTDRRRLSVAAALLSAGYLATPLVAVMLGSFVDRVAGEQTSPAIISGVLLVALLMMELMCAHFAHLSYFELGELMEIALRLRVFDTVNTGTSLERREQPDFADTLHLVERGIGQTRPALEAILEFGGLLLTLCASALLLIALDPLLGLLPLLSVLLVVSSRLARRAIDTAQREAAGDDRLAHHFAGLVSSPETNLELRMFGLADEVVTRHGAAWDRASDRLVRGERTAALVRCGGQLLFVAGYLAGLVLLVSRVGGGSATIGDLLLVLVLGVAIANRMGAVSGLLAVLRDAGTTYDRLRTLAEPAPPVTPARVVAEPVPGAIELRNVSFRYPGSPTPALRDIDLTLPAGSIVALIGENGAGKSTLANLLCGLYRPTTGRVSQDGVELTPAEWLPRVSCLFQDFARFELTLAESVGLGKVPEGGAPGGDEHAVHRALRRADAAAIPRSLPSGLASVVGTGYAAGTELSGGQWQKVALARSFMRENVSLLVLDEPAASLDARTERAMLASFRDAATASRARVTVLVTHRLSTVSLADVIVVLREGTVAEVGDHSELLGAGGPYAELYRMQRHAYR